MNPYLAFKLVHIALGCVALVAVWTALARLPQRA